MPPTRRNVELDLLNTCYILHNVTHAPAQYAPREEWLDPRKVLGILKTLHEGAAQTWSETTLVSAPIPWCRSYPYWNHEIQSSHFYIWYEREALFKSLVEMTRQSTKEAWDAWLEQWGGALWSMSIPVLRNVTVRPDGTTSDPYFVSHSESQFFRPVSLPTPEGEPVDLFQHRAFSLLNGATLAIAWARLGFAGTAALMPALKEWNVRHGAAPHPPHWFSFFHNHAISLADFPEFYHRDYSDALSALRRNAVGYGMTCQIPLIQYVVFTPATTLTITTSRVPWHQHPGLNSEEGRGSDVSHHWHAWLLEAMHRRVSPSQAAQRVPNAAFFRHVLPAVFHIYVYGAETVCGKRVKKRWLRLFWGDVLRRVEAETGAEVETWMQVLIHAHAKRKEERPLLRCAFPPIGFWRDMCRWEAWRPYKEGGVVAALKRLGTEEANLIYERVFQNAARAWACQVHRAFSKTDHALVGALVLEHGRVRRSLGFIF